MESVLVCDDSATVRLMIIRHLSALHPPGLRIVEAHNAVEAIEKFKEGPFDAAFLDGVFSDGTPMVGVLQNMLAARPDARVVVTSARPRDHPDIAEALGIGAYAYLAKPVRRDDVREILSRIDNDENPVSRMR